MKIKQVLIPGLALVIIFGIMGYFFHHAMTYVWTDNALVQARTTLLSSEISGTIESVAVEEHGKVAKGQPLATLRQSTYTNALDISRAEYAALQAQYRQAQLNRDRAAKLVNDGAGPPAQLEQAQSQLSGLAAKIAAATTAVRQSQDNVKRTVILSPVDGQIAKKSAEVGLAILPGQPLFGFVIGDSRWIIANFKETDLPDIRVGKSVVVKIDAIPGREFSGIVESISPSTGAIFSLLPPDNSVGNFTKVVQRIPVKIRLTHLTSADVTRLHAGLSAEVRIKR